MTGSQARRVRLLLVEARREGARSFRHGCCVGADEEAATIARSLGYELVGYPGRPVGDPKRSTIRNDVEYPVPTVKSPELARNRRIVDDSGRMIAAPREPAEILRSGTWATVRYARTAERRLDVALPYERTPIVL